MGDPPREGLRANVGCGRPGVMAMHDGPATTPLTERECRESATFVSDGDKKGDPGSYYTRYSFVG
ncbi:sugar transporter [Aspergillus luchuensis]|uniref:Sugar transporter n=1 Tax=Aspergillus kawachii TaxID=1069201 RepID=A0A146FMN4_ASPKA|nr:sugar transporter [Aspergillus luchuensis]